MTIRRFISISIRRAVFSLLLLVAFVNATAQAKFLSLQKDSVPVFRGFAVSFDLVGAGLMAFTDNGQYEGALRINLHDEWFPIIEAGLGKANHSDDVTHIHYDTSAPYFRIGIDKNMLKDKHGSNRLYAGLRYAFTSYKVNISRPDFPDPVWLWNTGYDVKDASTMVNEQNIPADEVDTPTVVSEDSSKYPTSTYFMSKIKDGLSLSPRMLTYKGFMKEADKG